MNFCVNLFKVRRANASESRLYTTMIHSEGEEDNTDPIQLIRRSSRREKFFFQFESLFIAAQRQKNVDKFYDFFHRFYKARENFPQIPQGECPIRRFSCESKRWW